MIEYEITYIDDDGDEHFMELYAENERDAVDKYLARVPLSYTFCSVRNPSAKEYFF